MREKLRDFFSGICPFLKSYYLLCPFGLELIDLITAFESVKFCNQYAHTERCIKIELQHSVPALQQNNAAPTVQKAIWLHYPKGIAVLFIFFPLCYSVERELELQYRRGKQ